MFTLFSLAASIFYCRPLCPIPDSTGEVIADSGATLWFQVLLFLSVMAYHSIMRTQANPLCLSQNLIS